MKKLISLLMAGVLIASLAACGGNNTESTTNAGSSAVAESLPAEDAENTGTSAGEEEDGETVVITLPGEGYETEDELLESAESLLVEEGVLRVEVTAEGNVEVEFTAAAYKAYLQELDDTIDDLITALVEEESSSILAVDVAADWSSLTVTVNREAYEGSFDSFSALLLATTVMTHRIYTNEADYTVTLNIADENGEVFETEQLPE